MAKPIFLYFLKDSFNFKNAVSENELGSSISTVLDFSEYESFTKINVED